MNKKTSIFLFIVGFTIVLVILGFVIFLIFQRTKKKTIVPSTVIQAVAVGAITAVSENDLVLFPHLSGDGKNLAFVDGRVAGFKQIKIDSKKTEGWIVSDLPLVIQAAWSDDNQAIFLRTRNPKNNKKESFVYDFANKKLIALDAKIVKAVWFHDEKKLLYHYLDEENKISRLIKSDIEGKNEQKIIDLEVWETNFDWLSKKTVALSTMPSDPSPTQVFQINIETGEKKKIIGNVSGFTTNGGGQILYQVFKKEKEPELKILDLKTKKEQTIELSTGLDKIVWSGDAKALIAGVSAGDNRDQFYQIGFENGKIKKLDYQAEDVKINITNLMPAPNNKDIYFTSNNLLYKITLP